MQKARSIEVQALNLEVDTTIKTNQLLISDSEMLKIDYIEFLNLSPQLRADIFMRLNDGNYLLVAREQSSINGDEMVDEAVQRNSYFIKRVDYKKCFGFKLITNEQGLPKDQEFILTIKDKAYKSLQAIDIDNGLLRSTYSIVASATRHIQSKVELTELCRTLNQIDGDVLCTSYEVAIMSVLIAQNAGWKSQNNLERLAIAAILHDVGVKDLPRDLITKPRRSWNFEDRNRYEAHCENGYSILKNLPYITEEILCVALEHHENSLGLGFPKRIKELKMHPFSRIVSLAIRFTELASYNSTHGSNKTPLEALHHIETVQQLPYSKEYFRCLKQLVINGVGMRRAA